MKKIILSVFAISQIFFFSCNKTQKTVVTTPSEEIQEQEEKEVKIDYSEKPKVRTVEITSIEYATGVASTDVAALKAKIIEGLSNRKNVRVVDRSKLNDVLNEHQKQQSLWASDDGRAEVGRQYNANALVYLEALSKTEIQVTIEDLDTFQQVVKLVNMSNVSEIENWDLSILSL